MKQKSLLTTLALLLFMIAGVGTAWAGTVTFTFNSDEGLEALRISKPASGYGTDLGTTAYTLDGVSLTAGHGSTNTRVWNKSGSLELRVYSGGSLTFTAPNAITKIELTGSTTPFSDEDDEFDSNTSTWTGYAASVTLTATDKAQISTITVTYGEDSPTPGVIDFESPASTYTYWKFTNMQSQQSDKITAHGDSYYGTTGDENGGKATASISTYAKVARPKTLTCYVSKQSNNTNYSIWYIQVSSDGKEWKTVEEKDATSMDKGVWVEFTADLLPYSDVYVRVYYEGSTAIRNIDDLTLDMVEPTAPLINATDPDELACNATSGSITYTIDNYAEGTMSATTNADWISGFTYSQTNENSGQVNFTTTANTSYSRSGTVMLVYTYGDNNTVKKEVTITQAEYATTYTLATSVDPGKHYIIVGEKDGTYAMGAQDSNNRYAIDVDVDDSNNTISVKVTDVVREFVIYGSGDNYYAIYDETQRGYLYAASNSKNWLRTQSINNEDSKWAISIDSETNVASIIADKSSNRNEMQYNSSAACFSCYGAGNSQEPVYLYVRVDEEAPAEEHVTITDVKYATYCSAKALDFSGEQGVKVYKAKANTNDVTLTAITDGIVPPNTGVIIYKDVDAATTVTAAVSTTLGAGDWTDNELIGTLERTIVYFEGEEKYNYILQSDGQGSVVFNKARPISEGFYYMPANRAYLSTTSTYSSSRLAVITPDDAAGIRNVIRAARDNDTWYDLQGRSVKIPAKGLYIVNGKKRIVK